MVFAFCGDFELERAGMALCMWFLESDRPEAGRGVGGIHLREVSGIPSENVAPEGLSVHPVSWVLCLMGEHLVPGPLLPSAAELRVWMTRKSVALAPTLVGKTSATMLLLVTALA